MKVKIIGFKVGVSRPTYNKTVEVRDVNDEILKAWDKGILVSCLLSALEKSDFLSIRKV